MLAAFVGCAGVGKNTIIQKLLTMCPDKYEVFPTLTTRAMRPGESEGNPYHFVTREEFERLISEDEIYEWQIIHNNDYYGGSRGVLRGHLESGKILIKDIDVLGARTYKEKLSDITKILSVFLYVENLDSLLERMRGRGDKEESIRQRAERFPLEMKLSSDSEYMVSNESVTDTADAVNCLLINEETLGGIYRPSLAEGMPSEDAICAVTSLEPVELVFNGIELLIVEGAARYVRAMREGKFIQKKIKRLTDTSLLPHEIPLDAWRDLLKP